MKLLDGSADTVEAVLARLFPGVEPGARPLDTLAAAASSHPGELRWMNHARAARGMGVDATIAWLEARREAERRDDKPVLDAMLQAVREDGEPTLFDYVVAALEDGGWVVRLE